MRAGRGGRVDQREGPRERLVVIAGHFRDHEGRIPGPMSVPPMFTFEVITSILLRIPNCAACAGRSS